ncbi:unnamed protein product, partial [marine sediment metagenome]
ERKFTESEKDKYLVALKSINKIIQEKEKSGEKEKAKYFNKKGVIKIICGGV